MKPNGIEVKEEEIKYRCKVHGELSLEGLNKRGIINGKQRYRCKACKKTSNQKSYLNNKEKTRQTQATWYKNNKKHRNKKSMEWYFNKCKNDPSFKVIRHTKAVARVRGLEDAYVRWLLKRNSTLSPSEIPHELVELKRATIKLKRQIKENMKC